MQRAPESGSSHTNVSPVFAYAQGIYDTDQVVLQVIGPGIGSRGWGLKYLDEDFVREVIDRRHDVALLLDRRHCRSEVVLVGYEGSKCAAESAEAAA